MTRSTLATALCLVLLTACGGSDIECTSSEECPLGLVCVGGNCLRDRGGDVDASDAAEDSEADVTLDTTPDVAPDVTRDAGTPDVPSGCGDGNLDAGEQCDDGNTRNGDGCSSDCELEPTSEEACDNGVDDDGDGDVDCDDVDCASADRCTIGCDAAAISVPWSVPACEHLLDLPTWEADRADTLLRSCEAPGASSAPRLVHRGVPTADASTTASFHWVTDADQRTSIVELGTSPGALTSAAAGWSFLEELDGERVVHEVHMCGLDSSTTYHYRVGAPGAWSETFEFTTAPAPGSGDTVRFAVAGGTRSPTHELWGQALAEMAERDVDFVLFTGAAVDTGTITAQWEQWWRQGTGETEHGLLTRIPILIALGGHDLAGDFAMRSGPGNRQDYGVRFGDVVVGVLGDSNAFLTGEDLDAQAAALDAALREHSDATWSFVVHSRSMYSASTRHGSQADTREALGPVVAARGVDVVFSGHDNNYERTRPICHGDDQVCTREDGGVVHVVTAGLGAPLYDNSADWWTEVSERTESYVVVEAARDAVTLTAYRLDGSVIDTFTLAPR